jgi:hypothetical protein
MTVSGAATRGARPACARHSSAANTPQASSSGATKKIAR